jgi:hypothetical protein
LLVRAGVPDDEVERMRGMYERMRKYADSFADDEYTALWDEAELEFESGSLRILHTPGHTPGSCSFLREADRTIIAGDCVLKRITPNPVLSPDPIDPSRRFPSLAEYWSVWRGCDRSHRRSSTAGMASRYAIMKNSSIATSGVSGSAGAGDRARPKNRRDCVGRRAQDVSTR